MSDKTQFGKGIFILSQFMVKDAVPPEILLTVQYSAVFITCNGTCTWAELGVLVEYFTLNSPAPERLIRFMFLSTVALPTGNTKLVLPNFLTQPFTCLLSASPL